RMRTPAGRAFSIARASAIPMAVRLSCPRFMASLTYEGALAHASMRVVSVVLGVHDLNLVVDREDARHLIGPNLGERAVARGRDLALERHVPVVDDDVDRVERPDLIPEVRTAVDGLVERAAQPVVVRRKRQ